MATADAPDLLVLRMTEAGAGGCRVELLDAQSGQLAAGTLALPLPVLGAGQAGSPDRQIREAVLGTYVPGAGRIAAIGKYLLQLLTDGGVGSAWQQARADAPGSLTVLDIRVREIARLPWELLTDNGVPVVLPPGGGLVRARFPFAAAPEPTESPLRVLVVVGSAQPQLAAEAEVAAIQRALSDSPWRAHTEVLVEPSRAEFYERVEQLQPHVLHFIGHGRFAPGTESPVLDLMDAETGDRWTLSETDIRAGLLNWVPRILVLNACRTAEVAEQSGVWSIAEASTAAGMPAVVCMQGLVDSGVAVRFSDEFYRALNAGDRVDVAVATARRSIVRALDLDRRDWALPVLHLRVAPAAVLPLTCGLTDQERADLALVPEFAEVRRLVDRDLQRRDMWWTMDPPAAGLPKGLVAVTGAVAAGRTRLVYSALLTCAGRGHQVRYVDLGGARRMSWIEVLYAIRDGAPSAGSALRAPLPAEAFSVFNREIERLAAGHEPRKDDPVPGVPPCPDFTAATEHAPTYARRIAIRFIEALRQVAADRPLTVAIDHLGGVNQGGVVAEQVTSHLSPLLFSPAGRGELSPVRLVVVLRDEECDLLTHDVRQLMHEVVVPGLHRRLYPFLQREHFARAGHEDAAWPRYEGLLAAFLGLIEDKWYPRLFGQFDEMVRGTKR
jgi:hypothetical protein